MSDPGPRILSHIPRGLLARVSERFPEATIVEVPAQGEVPKGLRGDVLLTQSWGSTNLAELLQCGVGWVHAYGTGVDAFPFDLLGDRPLTCSRGASAIPIAEWVMSVMLAFEKRLPETWVEEPPENWNIGFLGGLHGRTLGLVGLGGIGLTVARHALGFGMRVLATRRRAAPSPLPGITVASELASVLSEADHLVLAAPSTGATRHLIGREAFSRVKPGVHLVNVARGELLDQDALREALDQERVARASLDVCHPEPLPAGHWLYQHPRVRLSPHVSWSHPHAFDWLIEPFLEDLGNWLGGEPLRHTVDREAGY